MPIDLKGTVLGAALCVTALTSASTAQEGVEFYNGKTVTYIVATDPGGGYDTYGRLVAEFMQKHLPGSTFVVRNMPGAGNLIGANFLYASAPDGLTIGSFNTGLIYGQVAGQEGIRFDLGEMSWIGKAASDPRVLVVSTQSGIENYEQLRALKEPVKFATCGIGCASMVESTVLFEALDLPIDIITGYLGNDEQMAMRRGEVVGILSSRSSQEQFIAEGHGKFIAQIGGSDTDVPQLAEFVEDETTKGAIALVASQGTIGRLTAGPPGIEADRLETLRDAYAAAVADPEFLDRAEKLGLPIEPLVGESLAEAVSSALNQTPEIAGLLKSALEAK